MIKFRDLTEAKETVVFGFGRFNPPTTGHEKLIEKVASVAGSNPFFIYPSHTTGPKDPLPHAKKVAWMRKMFPKYKKNIIADRNAKTAIQIAEKLYKDGYKNLIMVAGSDRLREFDTLLQKYNDAPDKKGNQLFKFDSVKVVSAGERDPDAEGVEGMSASKMRAAAADGKFDDFKTGIPATLNDADKKKLYLEVRKNMGIREEREMGDDYDSLRDAYLTGKIWNVGEVVEANGLSGEVVRRGTNYLSFVTEDGKVHKAWLHEISENEVWSTAMAAGDKKYNDSLGGEKPLKAAKITFGTKRIPAAMKKKGMSKIKTKGLNKDKSSAAYIGKKKTYKEDELDERNYAKEYANYQGTPEQIARRSSRNKARRAMGDKAVKGMDVGHADNNPLNNSPENLRNEDPSKNRREPRLREASAPDIKKGDTIILNKAKRPYTVAGITDPKKKLPAESDKMVVNKITKSKDGRKAHLTYHDTKKRGGFAIYLDKMPDFMSVEIVESIELDENWWNDLTAKMSQIRHPKGWDKLAKEYADGMKDPEHRKHPSAWASNIAQRVTNVNGRQLVKYINKLVDAGKLPKELRAEVEMENFSNFVKRINEVKQDKDVDDKKGTQPAKYYAGDMAKSTKDKRDAHFKSKKGGPAPGDATAKTKPSKHTKKFKQMFGEEEMKCPPATQDLAINTKNRDATTKKYNYGPLNVDEPGDYWKDIAKHWKTTEEAAKKSLCSNCVAFDISERMKDCLPGETSDEDGELGYCWMHHFKCHSARACHTWAKGGPIKKDEDSYDWQERAFGKKEVLGKDADQGDYIDDFQKSDAPQFKGKSKEKRKEMAIAAYLSKNESLLDNVNKMLSESGHTDVASMKNKVQIAMSALQKMEGELGKLGDEDDLPTWWTNKVATAVSRLDDMSDYLDTQVEEVELDEKIAGLVKKAEKSGMPYSILKKVYDRGMAAWKTGHRPGTTPQQWAFARVNSFTTKSAGTWGKADSDLAKQVEQIEEACWDGYKQVGMKKKGDKEVPNCVPEETDLNEWGEITEKDDKSGKELNNPTKGDIKKYKVYVRNDKGNVVKVEFGDPNMEIKRDDPQNRANFRARHNCDQKKDKTTAGYWSCKFWSSKSVTDLMKG